MRQVGAPNYPRRFPGWIYPDVPELNMFEGSQAATDLARLIVTLSVDRRNLYRQRQSVMHYASGIIAAHTMTNASREFGYEASVSLSNGVSGWKSSGIHFASRPGLAAGLITSEEDFRRQQIKKQLFWKADQDGIMQPRAPIALQEAMIDTEPIDFEQYAAHYEILMNRISDPNSNFPLLVLSTDFTPYEGMPSTADYQPGLWQPE